MKISNKVTVITIMFILLAVVIWQWLFKEHQTIVLSDAPQGGDFILDASTGPFASKSQRGKVVLIYFGYSFCPDVCPTNLMFMAQALNALEKDELAKVQGVFISVDPERDTPDRLATYANHFHHSMVGVTGEPDYIAQLAQHYGAAYRKVEGESQGGYLIDHSSNIYVIAPDGSLSTILPHATPPEEILTVTRRLLEQTRNSQTN